MFKKSNGSLKNYLSILVLLHTTVEIHRQHVLGTRLLPRIAETQPIVRLFELEPIANQLLEDTVLIAQSITVRGDSQRCHRVQEARRQTTETSVTQTGVLFEFLEFFNVQTQLKIGKF